MNSSQHFEWKILINGIQTWINMQWWGVQTPERLAVWHHGKSAWNPRKSLNYGNEEFNGDPQLGPHFTEKHDLFRWPKTRIAVWYGIIFRRNQQLMNCCSWGDKSTVKWHLGSFASVLSAVDRNFSVKTIAKRGSWKIYDRPADKRPKLGFWFIVRKQRKSLEFTTFYILFYDTILYGNMRKIFGSGNLSWICCFTLFFQQFMFYATITCAADEWPRVVNDQMILRVVAPLWWVNC